VICWLSEALQMATCIITLGRQESSNEDGDWTWRRWVGFQLAIGFTGDPYLSGLSFDEQSLLAKAFLRALRTLKWTPAGTPDGMRPQPMVANTVRQATSLLGSAFRVNFKQSPFHNPDAPTLQPVIRSLMQAYTNEDPFDQAPTSNHPQAPAGHK
jgi:hypothetical protein